MGREWGRELSSSKISKWENDKNNLAYVMFLFMRMSEREREVTERK